MSSAAPRSVVLIAAGASEPGDALIAGVAALRRAGARVTLVSRVPPSPALAQQLDDAVPLPAGRLPRLGSGGSRAGVITLPGPLPSLRLDADRLPAAVRMLRHRTTRALLAAADGVVAVDQAAIPAAWLALRRHRRLVALSGLPAAVSRWASGE